MSFMSPIPFQNPLAAMIVYNQWSKSMRGGSSSASSDSPSNETGVTVMKIPGDYAEARVVKNAILLVKYPKCNIFLPIPGAPDACRDLNQWVDTLVSGYNQIGGDRSVVEQMLNEYIIDKFSEKMASSGEIFPPTFKEKFEAILLAEFGTPTPTTTST
jgi:hypothetical protein